MARPLLVPSLPMAEPAAPAEVLTRESLADLSLLSELRRHAPPEVSFLSPEAFADFLRRDVERWTRIIRSAGIKAGPG